MCNHFKPVLSCQDCQVKIEEIREEKEKKVNAERLGYELTQKFMETLPASIRCWRDTDKEISDELFEYFNNETKEGDDWIDVSRLGADVYSAMFCHDIGRIEEWSPIHSVISAVAASSWNMAFSLISSVLKLPVEHIESVLEQCAEDGRNIRCDELPKLVAESVKHDDILDSEYNAK